AGDPVEPALRAALELHPIPDHHLRLVALRLAAEDGANLAVGGEDAILRAVPFEDHPGERGHHPSGGRAAIPSSSADFTSKSDSPLSRPSASAGGAPQAR